MKRKVLSAFGLLAVFVAILFCLGLPGSKAQAKTYQIGTDVTYPPFEFANKKNKYVGIDIDIIKAIAKEEGFKVNVKPVGLMQLFNQFNLANSTESLPG